MWVGKLIPRPKKLCLLLVCTIGIDSSPRVAIRIETCATLCKYMDFGPYNFTSIILAKSYRFLAHYWNSPIYIFMHVRAFCAALWHHILFVVALANKEDKTACISTPPRLEEKWQANGERCGKLLDGWRNQRRIL